RIVSRVAQAASPRRAKSRVVRLRIVSRSEDLYRSASSPILRARCLVEWAPGGVFHKPRVRARPECPSLQGFGRPSVALQNLMVLERPQVQAATALPGSAGPDLQPGPERPRPWFRRA